MVLGKISSVFKSIQGEGLYVGVPQVFIRFWGCNMSCKFCDTILESYEEETPSKLVSKIDNFSNFHSVSLTGGEPLFQVEFLLHFLNNLNKRYPIYLETNGTLPDNFLRVSDYIDIVAMDFKLPSSTQDDNFFKEHKLFLRYVYDNKKEVFVKAVINSSTQLPDLMQTIDIIRGIDKKIPLILQPQSSFEDLLEKKLLSWLEICYDEGLVNVRIIPQIHKILGLE